MGRAIGGTIAGVFLGALVAIFVFGAIPPFNGDEQLILSIWMALGAITGAIVGGAGAIAAAIREGKSPVEGKANAEEMKYGRPPRSPSAKPDN